MTRSGHQTGLEAEKLCRLALRLKFYRIVAERYKTPMGEIDIVAARGRSLIAIEVKARATRDAAVASISHNQQQRIVAAMQDFVMRHPHYRRFDLRFDVMAVMPRRWPLHIKNAWQVD